MLKKAIKTILDGPKIKRAMGFNHPWPFSLTIMCQDLCARVHGFKAKIVIEAKHPAVQIHKDPLGFY